MNKSQIVSLLIISLAVLAFFIENLYIKVALVSIALILFFIKNFKSKTALTYFFLILGLGVIGYLVVELLVNQK